MLSEKEELGFLAIRRHPSAPVLTKRKSRGVSFYGKERPVFSNNQCVYLNDCMLPEPSSVFLLERRVGFRQVTGKTALPSYEPSEHFDIGGAESIGRRPYMEDRICVHCGLTEDADLVGVFDGHNGADAAQIASHELSRFLLETENAQEAFERLHEHVISQTESGTTATVALLSPSTITILHCGDSAAYVCRGGKTIKITDDHNTSNIDELAAVSKAGGTVEFTNGSSRVNGIISITRSIGDRNLHPPLSCIPDRIEINTSEVQTMAIMSDGISNVLTTDEIGKVLSDTIAINDKAAMLRNLAVQKKSADNMSVVVVSLL